ncbi:hypothetical protein IFM47457_06533 [Aspergillus lentulus]|nr:hypothetical protein IFM47457_06533 [Aspergillus lentulus]
MVTIGVDIKVVEASLGLSRQTFQYWVKKARERGYNPAVDFRILPEYVEDGKRSGRPKKTTESTEEAVLEQVREDTKGQEKSFEIPTFEAEWLNAAKQTTNSGLANEMKQEQLMFALPKRIEPSRTGRMRCSRVKCLLAAAQVMFGV